MGFDLKQFFENLEGLIRHAKSAEDLEAIRVFVADAKKYAAECEQLAEVGTPSDIEPLDLLHLALAEFKRYNVLALGGYHEMHGSARLCRELVKEAVEIAEFGRWYRSETRTWRGGPCNLQNLPRLK